MMDDQHEEPINPYQSPRSDFGAEEEAAGPERVYGLREPIRIQGKPTAKDLQQAVKSREKCQATISGKIRVPLFIIVGLAIVVALCTSLLLNRSTLALVVPLVTLVVIFLAGWLLVVWINKACDRKAPLETMTFTDESIVDEWEEGRVVYRWSAFCQCLCSDEMVVLYLEPAGTQLICPKRFFASEEDWTTLRALVRCKLPEDDQSARRLAAARDQRLASEGPDVERTVEATDRQGRRPLAGVEGAISWEDWKHVQQLIVRPWLDRLARVGCLLALLILALIPAGLRVYWHGIGELGPALLMSALYIPVFIVLLFVWPALRLRRQWKRQEGPFGPFEVRVWEEGVEFTERTSAVMVPWTGFAKFTLSDRVLLLDHVGAQAARFIPREFFSSAEEWEALLRLVREKVPERSSQNASSRSE
jgi:hypothetical protein